MDKIIVSVICTAYNHEPYIRDALNGFVMQKTNFKYEVLINDDASTDKTADIIREYEEKYPDIIKPTYQKENQYSKGVKIGKDILFPQVKGKYIALCEGDDYWTDENKLQIQVDFLENHTDYSACVHNSVFNEIDSGKSYIKYEKCDKEIGLKDCIGGGASAYHTSSLMYRKELAENRPDFCYAVSKVGDYSTSIYLSLSGKIFYFGNVMSVYRIGTPYSWTKNYCLNRGRMEKCIEQSIEMLKMADRYSDFRFTDLFQKKICEKEFMLFLYRDEYRKLLGKKYSNIYKKYPLNNRIKIRLKAYFPFIYKIKRKIKKKG